MGIWSWRLCWWAPPHPSRADQSGGRKGLDGVNETIVAYWSATTIDIIRISTEKKRDGIFFFSTNTPLSIDAHDLVTVRAGRKGAADAHLRQPTMALIIIKTDEKWQRNGTRLARRPPVSSAATTTLIYFNTFFSLRRGERIEEIHTHTSIPPDGACFFLFFSFPSRPPSLLRS